MNRYNEQMMKINSFQSSEKVFATPTEEGAGLRSCCGGNRERRALAAVSLNNLFSVEFSFTQKAKTKIGTIILVCSILIRC